MKQYQTDKEERETAGIGNVEVVNPVEFAVVAEPEFQYGAEIFEMASLRMPDIWSISLHIIFTLFSSSFAPRS